MLAYRFRRFHHRHIRFQRLQPVLPSLSNEGHDMRHFNSGEFNYGLAVALGYFLLGIVSYAELKEYNFVLYGFLGLSYFLHSTGK